MILYIIVGLDFFDTRRDINTWDELLGSWGPRGLFHMKP